ncbi:MAG: universal stress protein [Gemmatimonadaceae bacterium]
MSGPVNRLAAHARIPLAEAKLQSGSVDFQAGLLFASDGSPAASNAEVLARLVAHQRQLSGSTITVLPPSPFNPPTRATDDGNACGPTCDSHCKNDAVDSGACTWKQSVAYGNAGIEIVKAADSMNSQMIVIGMRPHELVDRLFRDETALVVMQRANVPVLGIASTTRALPASVAVGIDFTRASIAALHAAAAITRPGGRLLLAHVCPHSLSRRGTPASLCALYNDSIADTLTRLQTSIQSNWDLQTEIVLLTGAVVPELRLLVHSHDVNLLALGKSSDSNTPSNLGSVPTALLRIAECSLLVTPADALNARN